MSEISDAIQAKCIAFGDRVIKLNDYLLEQAASKRYDGGGQKADKRGKTQTSYVRHQTCRIPVHLQAIATLCNQLLRAGTSIGANNAEASSAISKADFKSKSYIALKEARESLYWLELLHRNKYLTEVQYQSLFTDCEEIVKVLTHRCKKLDENKGGEQ